MKTPFSIEKRGGSLIGNGNQRVQLSGAITVKHINQPLFSVVLHGISIQTKRNPEGAYEAHLPARDIVFSSLQVV